MSQSTLNFQNCGWVISAWGFGGKILVDLTIVSRGVGSGMLAVDGCGWVLQVVICFKIFVMSPMIPRSRRYSLLRSGSDNSVRQFSTNAFA